MMLSQNPYPIILNDHFYATLNTFFQKFKWFERSEKPEVHGAMVSTVSSQPTKTEIFVTSRNGYARNQEVNHIHKFYETLINVPISGE